MYNPTDQGTQGNDAAAPAVSNPWPVVRQSFGMKRELHALTESGKSEDHGHAEDVDDVDHH